MTTITENFETAVGHARYSGTTVATYDGVTATRVTHLAEGMTLYLVPTGPTIEVTSVELPRDEHGMVDFDAAAFVTGIGDLNTSHHLTVSPRDYFRTEPVTAAPPAPAPRIEVLTVRDPDGATEVRVFVDGHEVEYSGETIDAGAGHTRADWDEHTETVRAMESYTPVFRDAVLDAREDPLGDEHITDH